MDAIELTGSDAARITLALIADRMDTLSEMRLGQLQDQWQALGLRADDLIQALTTLNREQQLLVEGKGESAIVRMTEDSNLAKPGKGISTLEPRLREILELAEKRKASSGVKSDQERRSGFK